MRRPIKMVAPGTIQGRIRPQRIPSSTCARPSVSQDGTVLGVGDTEIDFSDHPRSLNGEEMFLVQHALENGITEGDGCYYH
jgi:hypothetical protein